MCRFVDPSLKRQQRSKTLRWGNPLHLPHVLGFGVRTERPGAFFLPRCRRVPGQQAEVDVFSVLPWPCSFPAVKQTCIHVLCSMWSACMALMAVTC